MRFVIASDSLPNPSQRDQPVGNTCVTSSPHSRQRLSERGSLRTDLSPHILAPRSPSATWLLHRNMSRLPKPDCCVLFGKCCYFPSWALYLHPKQSTFRCYSVTLQNPPGTFLQSTIITLWNIQIKVSIVMLYSIYFIQLINEQQ